MWMLFGCGHWLRVLLVIILDDVKGSMALRKSIAVYPSAGEPQTSDRQGRGNRDCWLRTVERLGLQGFGPDGTLGQARWHGSAICKILHGV